MIENYVNQDSTTELMMIHISLIIGYIIRKITPRYNLHIYVIYRDD